MNKVKRRAANPRGRYEQMLFNRPVLLVAVPLCAMSILLGASYFSQETARQRAGLDKLAQPPEKQPEREEQEKHLSLAYGSPPPRPVRTCRSGQG